MAVVETVSALERRTQQGARRHWVLRSAVVTELVAGRVAIDERSALQLVKKTQQSGRVVIFRSRAGIWWVRVAGPSPARRQLDLFQRPKIL